MKEVTQPQVIRCLESVGIQPGDGLLVHSAMQYLGRPVGGIGMYLEAIMEVIGPRGTIAVPTFNFGFTKGMPYDPDETPSEGMGAFSEYVRERPEARRTSHPTQSLALIGEHTQDLVTRDTPSAFDPGSAFERMLELDFKLLLLGADISASSIFHYSEQRHQVPYRFWKDFSGQIHTPKGWEMHTYRMYVRYLDPEPNLTAAPIEKLLKERGQWRSAELNYGRIAACTLREFVAAEDFFFSADPWSLVTNRSDFS